MTVYGKKGSAIAMIGKAFCRIMTVLEIGKDRKRNDRKGHVQDYDCFR